MGILSDLQVDFTDSQLEKGYVRTKTSGIFVAIDKEYQEEIKPFPISVEWETVLEKKAEKDYEHRYQN